MEERTEVVTVEPNGAVPHIARRPRKPKATAIAKVNEAPPPAPVSEAAAIFSMIERMATDPTMSIERVERTFAFYQNVQADQARKDWGLAFTRAQAAMEPVKKDAENKHTHSKYATHAALDKALRPIYSAHGFGVTFDTEESPKPEHVRMVLYLVHEAGHERRYQADIPADGKGPKDSAVMTKTHAAGSAMTTGKRYLLGNAWNIAVIDKDDDDGNAAGGLTRGVITPEQAEELANLITKTKSDIHKFLALGKLESLSDLPAKDFEGAKGMLLAKKAKMASGAKP